MPSLFSPTITEQETKILSLGMNVQYIQPNFYMQIPPILKLIDLNEVEAKVQKIDQNLTFVLSRKRQY